MFSHTFRLTVTILVLARDIQTGVAVVVLTRLGVLLEVSLCVNVAHGSAPIQNNYVGTLVEPKRSTGWLP